MARFFKEKKNTSIQSKHQSVTVTKLDHLAAGIAYQNNKPIFIDGALPGEEVVIQFTEQKSKFSRAKLIKVLTESEARVHPFCQHYQQCGGCDFQHLTRSAQVSHKQQALSHLMNRFAQQTLTLSPSIVADDQGYRRRARFSLWWDKKTQQLQFGFRRKQSKTIVTITDCPVLEPQLNRCLPELKVLLSEFTQPEKLGHLELVKAENTNVLLLRHLGGRLATSDQQALCEFAERHQMSLYLLDDDHQLQHVQGETPYYQENGFTMAFQPTHFIQVNQHINQRMVSQAIDWLDVQASDRVLDLFCGLGNFSLPLARLAESVIGVEGVDEMVAAATANAHLNQLDNCTFYQANLEQDMTKAAWSGKKFDKILLDPARSGAAGIVEQLAQFSAQRIVYVSCNPATLARDSQSLLNQGYELAKLAMLDMFPHTSHLESMALFIKSR